MPKDAAGHLVPGRVAAAPSVPSEIARPPYVGAKTPPAYTAGDVYSGEQVERIRAASAVAARALSIAGRAVRAGVTTRELDEIAHEVVVGAGAYPSPLGYRGFPRATCTSVNEVICHGIPDDTVLDDGDIVNIDVTAYLDGMHGDTNATFIVGTPAPEVASLVDRTRTALARGIRAVAPGRAVNVIGRTIESYAARFGYGVVREFTGHGVGGAFHTGLVIPHYDSEQHTTTMVPGMVFTIEPMLTLGTHEWSMWPDGWTAVTRDASITAQFEHTILVTESGAEILTITEEQE